MALEERLELEISEALRGIDSIESALGGAASSFKVALAEALDVLGIVTVGDVDASSVTSGITDAVAAADTTVTPEADASGVTGEIDAAVAAADAVVTPEANAENITSEIEAAVSSADSTVEVDADTSAAEDAISGLGGQAGGATDEVEGLGLATEALGGASEGGASSLGALTSGLEVIPGKGKAAAAGLAVVLGGVTELATKASDYDATSRRFNASFGELAADVRAVDFGGINEDLFELATRTGNSIEPIQQSASRLNDLGLSAGVAAPEVATTVKQIEALAVRATTLNPSLGESGDVADRMANAFSKGGRGLAAFGISMSKAEIDARAANIALERGSEVVTAFDRTAAGAQLTVERLGGSFGTTLNEGAKSSAVEMKSLRVEFEETLTKLGAPLVAPFLDTLRASQPVAESLTRVLAELGQATLPVVTKELVILGDSLSLVADGIHIIQEADSGLKELASHVGTDDFNLGDLLGRPDEVVGNLGGKLKDFVLGSDEASESEKRNEAAVKALTAAYESLSSPLAETRESFIQQQVQAGELGPTLASLGLSYENLSNFAGHGKLGLTELDAAIKASGASSKVSGDDLGKLRDVVRDSGADFQKSARAALDDAVAKGEITKAARDAAVSSHELASGGRDYLGALKELRPAMEADAQGQKDAASATGQHAAAVDALGRSLQDVLAAEEQQIQKELGLASASLGAESAARAREKAEADLAKAIQEHGAGSTEASDADLRLRQATESQVESLVRLAAQNRDTTVAQLENAGVNVDAATKSGIYKDQLIALANTVADPMRTQILALSNDIRAVPPSSNTTINVEAAAAFETLDQTSTKIEAIPNEKLVQIFVEVFGAENAQSVINQLSHDAGNILVPEPPHHMAGLAAGPVTAGVPIAVGEKEPEFFFPRQSGVIANQSDLQNALWGIAERMSPVQGGGAPTVTNITNNINEVAADPEATAFAVSMRQGARARR